MRCDEEGWGGGRDRGIRRILRRGTTRAKDTYIPVLLQNANSFVIILIYAPVSRRATRADDASSCRRPAAGERRAARGCDFVYTLLGFRARNILLPRAFPADCKRLLYTPDRL